MIPLLHSAHPLHRTTDRSRRRAFAVLAASVLPWVATALAQRPTPTPPAPPANPPGAVSPIAPGGSVPATTNPPANNPASPAAGGAPTPVGAPIIASTPAPPADTQEGLLNALNPGEVQEAINLLRSNYIRPGDVDDRAMARATLSGILDRLEAGATLLPKPGTDNGAPALERVPDGFQSETIGSRTGYARLGALTRDHLGALDRALKGFTDAKLPALIFDLRATGVSSDYDLAADVIRRFVAKGRPLFTLRKPSINQDRLFTSNADPAFTGLVLIVADADTAGAAEAIAAVLRFYNRCLVVGETTAGQAVEYADLRLSGGTLLRVAVSQVLLPGNVSIFPGGLKPDVPVKMSRADLLTILRQAGTDKDHPLASFVLDTERARFNEAALVSGINPEYDAARDAQAARRRGDPPPKPPLRDLMVQRALDLATAIVTLDPKG